MIKTLKMILKFILYTISLIVPLVIALLDLIQVFNGNLSLYQDNVGAHIGAISRAIFLLGFVVYDLFVILKVLNKDKPNFSYLIVTFLLIASASFVFYYYEWYFSVLLMVSVITPGLYVTLHFFGIKL